MHSYSEFIYNKLSPVTYFYVYILNNLFTIDLQISYCPEISFDCTSDTYLVQNRKSFFSPRLTACNYFISFWSLRLSLAALSYFFLICIPYPICKHTGCVFPLKVLADLPSLHSLPPCTKSHQLTSSLNFTSER